MPTYGHVENVNQRCREFLEDKRRHVEQIDPNSAAVVDSLLALTAGGKKLRPLLAWLGYRAAAGDQETSTGQQQEIIELGTALELFQAAALVHDDVIDRSDTRRGQPSTHRWFTQRHRDASFAGSAEHFGISGAILAGDLALAWANEAFTRAETLAETSGTARGIFERMHTEVITGQYLDVLAEVDIATDPQTMRSRARNVLIYKAAKYSVEYPLILGAALGGGSEDLLAALSEIGLPLGEAFQLQDDLLGVFGDPELTGKPVGDDLREGKRTELVAYGLTHAPAAEADELEQMLGTAELTQQEVSRAQEILRSCGAAQQVEAEISALAETSRDARGRLPELGVSAAVLDDLDDLAQRLVSRTS